MGQSLSKIVSARFQLFNEPRESRLRPTARSCRRIHAEARVQNVAGVGRVSGFCLATDPVDSLRRAPSAARSRKLAACAQRFFPNKPASFRENLPTTPSITNRLEIRSATQNTQLGNA